MDKLAVIEQCIQNDIAAIKELQGHLKKLCDMRNRELEAEGITIEEWDSIVRRFNNELR